MELLQALHASALAAGLRDPTLYPFVNAGHILSLAVLVGSIATLDLRVLGLFRTIPLGHIAPPLSRMAAIGLACALVTGFLLFSVRPVAYAQNPAFLAKLALVLLGILNAAAAHTLPYWRAAVGGEAIHTGLKLSAGLSLAIWVCAVVSGRWIAFVE
jgi:hypothetical protein